jgi:hypothetical protein
VQGGGGETETSSANKGSVPFQVVDAAGTVVGRLFDTTYLQVQMSVNGQKYIVPLSSYVQPDGTMTTKLDYIDEVTNRGGFFTTLDCSGTAYFFSSWRPLPFAYTGFDQSGHVLLYPQTKTSEFIVAQSLLSGGECTPEGTQGQAFHLEAPIDITSAFVRPFSIK